MYYILGTLFTANIGLMMFGQMQHDTTSITIGGASIALLGIFWRVSTWVANINSKLDNLLKHGWSLTHQERWSHRLKEQNPKLSVPDPLNIYQVDSLQGEKIE